jgi:signal transduction histidine kinase
MQGLQSLESLLKGLLDYSRLSRTEALAAPGPVRVQGLFDSICLHAEPLARARGLQLRVRPSTAWVLSDPLLLEQILRNLLSNAIQHTDSGGVLLALRRRGTTAWLEVRDTGPGIAAADQQRIFTLFEQVDGSATRAFEGAGLGLALCKRLVEGMGGNLGVESEPGKGSCFWVKLPLARAG